MTGVCRAEGVVVRALSSLIKTCLYDKMKVAVSEECVYLRACLLAMFRLGRSILYLASALHHSRQHNVLVPLAVVSPSMLMTVSTNVCINNGSKQKARPKGINLKVH